MIRKHVIKPAKKWVKKKIKNTYKEFDDLKEKIEIKDPDTIYFPYSEKSEFYVISKTKEDHETCEYGLPIPPENLWLGYGKNNTEYLFGKLQVEKMLEIVRQSDFAFEKGNRILDFGCGAGRMLRWLKPLSGFCEIWGTDISAEHIIWANKYLKPPFNFATTTTIPHLPFEDRYFDFIFAGSVFTHIGELADAWLLELRRILSAGGRLYLTINDKNSLDLMNSVPEYKELWLTKYFNENLIYHQNKNTFGIMIGGKGPAAQVFYDIEFFCESVSAFYDVLSVNEEAYGFQTAILLKKK